MSLDPGVVLARACHQVGLDAAGAELLRAAENHLYRLPGGVVARVTRAGQLAAARKEVQVSRWLAGQGVPVVIALSELAQPAEVAGHAVTFWRELPPHRHGNALELADLLRQVHALPVPDFELPRLMPFVRLGERLAEDQLLPADERAWLLDHLSRLEQRYAGLPADLPRCAIHGDAWPGNVATTDRGPILLDLERFALGPPEWDLTGMAVSYTTFGSMSSEQWPAFCERYGQDVTAWQHFELFLDIRELRKVTFAIQMAGRQPELAEQANYRLACIRGRHGPRPWGWSGVP